MTDQKVITDFCIAIERIRELAGRLPRVLVGICGAPGSGKTTLATSLSVALAAEFSADFVRHVPMDGFHLADVELRRLGRLDRKGAPDTFDANGYAALLARLRSPGVDETVYAPQFERDFEQPIAGAIGVQPAVRVVISEGNYLLLEEGGWAAVAPKFDEVWFVESTAEVRVPRLVRRHVSFGKPQSQAEDWVREVDENNAELIERTRGRAHARVAAEMVLRAVSSG